jgi:hypothetical protein
MWSQGDAREAKFQVFLSEMHGAAAGRVICMPIRDEDIFQILREATEPLFPSEITVRLNREFGAGATVDEVATRLTRLKQRSTAPHHQVRLPQCPAGPELLAVEV